MKKITVVGRGLDPAKHLSLEAIRTLKNADIILGIEPETDSWKTLREEFNIPKIIDVGTLYINGAKDLQNYTSFIAHAFEALKTHNHVVLLVAGHPRVGVTFAQILTQHQNNSALNFEINFIEGLSSFDVMLNDLEIDPLERGSSVLDSNRLLLFQYNLEPSMNHFIYHICSVGTDRVHYSDSSKDNKITALQDYLESFYDRKKEIFLCKASNGQSEKGKYISLQVCDLAANIHQIDFGTTLFIPAEKPSKFNFKFYQNLQEAL